uniref:G-protein coupled receptors family 1 profile domain-containing protein n=1 Tax=Latimeria chalumnae TaxID=7897 RepID=H3AN57_LATCH
YGDIEKIVIGVVLSIITLMTIAGNALVIISVCIVKKLRQPSNYLVVSLAAADLSVAIAVMPFVIITDLVGGVWLFGKVFCNVFIAMDVMCCTASIMTLCVISVDRRIKTICCIPFFTGNRLKPFPLTLMLGSCSRITPSFLETPPSPGGWGAVKLIDFVNGRKIEQDQNSINCIFLHSAPFKIIIKIWVAFYIPMTVMLVMYKRIYKAAKVSAEKHKFLCIPRQRGKAAEECATLSKLLRHDRKNISIFKREQKAARTLGIIVGGFTFCWLPFFLMSTARPFICGIQCSCMPLRLERTLLWLGYANSLINPLIYAFFNRDLRTTFWNLLRC